MNRLFRWHLFTFVIIPFITSSCDNEGVVSTLARKGRIVAEFSNNTDLFEAEGNALFYDNKIMISGVDRLWPISIIVREQHGEGAYDVMGSNSAGTPNVEVNYYFSNSSKFYEETVVGSVVLTEINEIRKTISGTFTCKLIDHYGAVTEITSGSFTKIPYKTAPVAVLTCQIDGRNFTADAFEVSTRDSLSPDGNTIRFISLAGTMDDSKSIQLSFTMEPSDSQHIYSIGDPNMKSSLSCEIDSENFPAGSTGELMVFNNEVLRSLSGLFHFEGENSELEKKVNVTGGDFRLMFID